MRGAKRRSNLKNMIASSETMLDWYDNKGVVPIFKKGALPTTEELEEKMQQFRSTRHCKYMLNFHIVWCPRGRVKILFHEVRVLLRIVIEAICKENNWIALAIEPMPDHIHLFVSTKDSREIVLGKLKGQSSAFLQRCFPILREALTDGHLWSGSYFISSIGNVSGKTLLKYLAKQWKEFGDPRYELTMAALHKNQKVLTGFFSTPPN